MSPRLVRSSQRSVRVTAATAASNGGGPPPGCMFRRAWPHQLGGVVGCAASFLVLFVSFISSKQIRNISCSYNFSPKFSHVDFFHNFFNNSSLILKSFLRTFFCCFLLNISPPQFITFTIKKVFCKKFLSWVFCCTNFSILKGP